MTLSDATLVQRVLDGETECFRTLVERYQDAVYGAALSKIGSRAAAEDVAQETFISAFESLSKLRDPSRLGCWLYRIAQNKAKMHLRSQSVRKTAESASKAALDTAPATDEIVAQREANANVLEALAGLAEPNRETATLFYIDGYSHDDISEFTGRPVGTIKRRLHDARKQLRKELIAMVEHELKASRPGKELADRVLRSISRVRVRRTGTSWDYALLTDEDGRSFLLRTHSEEADFIDAALSGEPMGARSVFAPALSVLDHYACRVDEVTIVAHPTRTGHTPRGLIQVASGDRKAEVEAAAADAASVALAAGAPIYIDRSVGAPWMLTGKNGKPIAETTAWRRSSQRAADVRKSVRPFRDIGQVIRELERTPNSQRARRVLSELRVTCVPPKIMDKDGALDAFEQWVDNCQGTKHEAMATGLLGCLLLRPPAEDLDRAIALLEHAYELAPHSPHVVFDLATAYAEAGKRDAAIELLEALAEAHPRFFHLPRISECANFQSLWRRKRFRECFGEPHRDARDLYILAQMYMDVLYPSGCGPRRTKRQLKPRALPIASDALKRRASAALGCAGLLGIKEGCLFRKKGDVQERWLRLTLEGGQTAVTPVIAGENICLSRALWRNRFTHPEPGAAAAGLLAAAGIKVAAVMVRPVRSRIECALIASKGKDDFTLRAVGFTPLVIALWAAAPVLIAEDLAEQLSESPAR